MQLDGQFSLSLLLWNAMFKIYIIKVRRYCLLSHWSCHSYKVLFCLGFILVVNNTTRLFIICAIRTDIFTSSVGMYLRANMDQIWSLRANMDHISSLWDVFEGQYGSYISCKMYFKGQYGSYISCRMYLRANMDHTSVL